MTTFPYEQEVRTIEGDNATLEKYRGTVLLIVNTASECGFTPQYEGLEALYQQYADDGFVVLGFPCSQFGNQEPGTEEEISNFCEQSYQVSFPMHTKINVNGEETHPLFAFLKERAPGIFGTKNIKWNFTKFLISRDGSFIKRFAPFRTPASLMNIIEQQLSKST